MYNQNDVCWAITKEGEYIPYINNSDFTKIKLIDTEEILNINYDLLPVYRCLDNQELQQIIMSTIGDWRNVDVDGLTHGCDENNPHFGKTLYEYGEGKSGLNKLLWLAPELLLDKGNSGISRKSVLRIANHLNRDIIKKRDKAAKDARRETKEEMRRAYRLAKAKEREAAGQARRAAQKKERLAEYAKEREF